MLRRLCALGSAAVLVAALALSSASAATAASYNSPVLLVNGHGAATRTVAASQIQVVQASPDTTCPSQDYCESVTISSTAPGKIVVYTPGWQIGSTSGDCGSESFVWSPTSQTLYPAIYDTATNRVTVGATPLTQDGTTEWCPYPNEATYELGYATASSNTQNVTGSGTLIYGPVQ